MTIKEVLAILEAERKKAEESKNEKLAEALYVAINILKMCFN